MTKRRKLKFLVTCSTGRGGTELVGALGLGGVITCRVLWPQGGVGAGGGNWRGAGAVRDYFGARGRCAPENDAAIQIWRWGKTGFRAAVDVVGDARRCRRDFAIRD